MSTRPRKYELKARAESQRETRERIARAAAELHELKGVAQTTVSEIARRAGVQRLTVYNHFPNLAELLPACSAHYMRLHPQPTLDEAFATKDPRQRLRMVLEAFYQWYRETEAMLTSVYSDRASVAELDEFMRETADRQLAELATSLAAGFGADGDRGERRRALAAVALHFWTWQRLNLEGLDDEAAADLMASAVARR
jgi:AcrR family transcriptional regulator